MNKGLNTKVSLYQRVKKVVFSFVGYHLEKRKKQQPGIESNKIIVLNISDPYRFHRYLYTLVKFFSFEGYVIYFPNFTNYLYRNFVYNRQNPGNFFYQIFKENLVRYGEPPKSSVVSLELNDHNVSAHYFAPFFDLFPSRQNAFHIPMAMYPRIYKRSLHYQLDSKEDRKSSVFMIGNLDAKFYSDSNVNIFQVKSRATVYKFLKDNKLVHKVNSKAELNDFIKSKVDKVCLMVDIANFKIKLEDLRPTIREFSFYLTLPGVMMPHSHNVIEALSVETIPIIQKNYARMMVPPLEHMKTAIIFENLQYLVAILDLAMHLPLKDLKVMRKNIAQYYLDHLAPEAVTEKIMSGDYSYFYLMAEEESVRLLHQEFNNQIKSQVPSGR